jgi:putative aldouronate transport system permease protein
LRQTLGAGGAVLHRVSRGTSILKNRYLYLMLVPGIAFYVLFKYLPMAGIVIAFKEYSVFKGVWGSPWVGFQNFSEIFRMRDFWTVLRNTLLISIYKTVFGFPAPIVLALLLNYLGNQTFKRTVQTILYLPYFVSWVVVSGIMLSILSPSFGIAGEIFRMLGLKPVNLLAVPRLFRGILVLSDIWKSAGFGTIIYLATLSTIDPNLYEASDIDGARRLQQVWHISLPSIRPVIVLLLILQLGYLLDAGFEQILVMQNAIVQSVSEIFDTYVYHVGLQQGRYSLTTAIGLFKSVVAAILIAGADRFAKAIGESGLL